MTTREEMQHQHPFRCRSVGIQTTTLSILLVLSCGSQQQPIRTTSLQNCSDLQKTENPDEPVARVNGHVITGMELQKAAAQEISRVTVDYQQKLYQIRKENLERLVVERLVEIKAKSEGITPDQLLEREVASQITDPSEEDLQEVYQETASKFGGAFPPFYEVKARIRDAILSQRRENAEMEYFDGLLAEAQIELLLPPLLPDAIDVPTRGPSKGNPNAAVTIVEFADFECTFCANAQSTIARILQTYGDQVRLVYRDFPMPFHRFAAKAAEAAHCADDQGKYWQMHEVLYQNSDTLRVEDLKSYAEQIGLDSKRFDSCLDSSEKAPVVEQSLSLAKKLDLQGTPAFFINGRLISGAQSYQRFKEIIDIEIELASKKH